MRYRKLNRTYVIVLSKGEKIIESLTELLIKNEMPMAYFWGIGAVSEAELAHFNLEKKEYSYKKFKGQLEIVSMIGNLAWLEGKPVVHAHISLGDNKMRLSGGHLKEATVSATCEIVLKVFEEKVERKHDPEIGLNLLKF